MKPELSVAYVLFPLSWVQMLSSIPYSQTTSVYLVSLISDINFRTQENKTIVNLYSFREHMRRQKVLNPKANRFSKIWKM
jgi:hypothetical protein